MACGSGVVYSTWIYKCNVFVRTSVIALGNHPLILTPSPLNSYLFPLYPPFTSSPLHPSQVSHFPSHLTSNHPHLFFTPASSSPTPLFTSHLSFIPSSSLPLIPLLSSSQHHLIPHTLVFTFVTSPHLHPSTPVPYIPVLCPFITHFITFPPVSPFYSLFSSSSILFLSPHFVILTYFPPSFYLYFLLFLSPPLLSSPILIHYFISSILFYILILLRFLHLLLLLHPSPPSLLASTSTLPPLAPLSLLPPPP